MHPFAQKSCDDKVLLDLLKAKVKKYDANIKVKELEMKKYDNEGNFKDAKEYTIEVEKIKLERQEVLDKIKGLTLQILWMTPLL